MSVPCDIEYDALTVDTSLVSLLRSGNVSISDLEAIRLILRGDSVIDWHRLDFQSPDEVDRFLALHLLDPSDPLDRERLRFLFMEAVNYLEEHLGLNFPADLRDPEDVREIFLLASQRGGFRRRQILACVILKLMQVINHMEVADLRFQTTVSEARLIELAERRIITCAEQMRQAGFPLVAFFGSRKTRSSVITKLIAKKETIATTIFDKLRFRLITEQPSDVMPSLCWLVRNVFPFNHVIPGQSHNNLVTLQGMVEAYPNLVQMLANLQKVPSARDELHPEPNPFSGTTYRMINFIVDFPVRIDQYLVDMDPRRQFLLGRTVLVLVEFQILDQYTARRNEEGENAHHLYKKRQRRIVSARLKRGSVTRDREGNGAA